MPEEIPEPEGITEEEYQKLLERIRPKRPPKPLRELQPKATSPLPSLPPLLLPRKLARQVMRLPVGKKPGHFSFKSSGGKAKKDPEISVTCPECGTTFMVSGPFPRTVTCSECGWSGEIKL